MGLVVEMGAESRTIRLQGAVDVGCAAELKTTLLEALAPDMDLRVALDDVTEMDVTAMQLLYSAAREAKLLGVRFTIAGEPPEVISSALAAWGFDELLNRA